MTTKKTKVTQLTPDTNIPLSGTIVAFNDPALKAMSVLASALLYTAPQFTLQASTQNIVSLADTFYKFFIGGLQLTDLEKKVDAAAQPVQEAAKFA